MNHPFVVGKTYLNRDGEYEVVRIDDDSMVIRYLDSGEEIKSSIQLQARIWQNLSWDEEVEAERRKKADSQIQKNYGQDFTGLIDSDFKTNIAGTTWRSRKGLAGMVASHLSSIPGLTFISWAIYPWPVSFLTHRENYNMAAFEYGAKKAKYTIEVDEQNVYYGLYIEKNGGEMDKTWDWPRLLSQLNENQKLQEIIAEAELSFGARFLARSLDGVETSHFSNGLNFGAESLWDELNPSVLSIPERLRKINQIPLDHWGEVYIIGTIAKEKAIQSGIHLAKEMAKNMRLLLPLYTAATSL